MPAVNPSSLFYLQKARACMESAGQNIEMPIHEVVKSAETYLANFLKAFKENPKDTLPCFRFMRELQEELVKFLLLSHTHKTTNDEIAWVIASAATIGVLHGVGALTGKFDVPRESSTLPASMAYDFQRGANAVQEAIITENPLPLREYSQHYLGMSKKLFTNRDELEASGTLLRFTFKFAYIQGLVVTTTLINKLTGDSSPFAGA